MRRQPSSRWGRALQAALRLCCVLAPGVAAAQTATERRRVQLEARGDVIAARTTAVHAALGGLVPVGTYLRLGAAAGGGIVIARGSSSGDAHASARADLIGRFVLDPFREARWGPYAGAGVSALYHEGGRWRGYLLTVFGVEGSAVRGVLPAVEVGLDGGTRVGLVLRQAVAGRR